LHAAARTLPVWTYNEAVLGLIRESPRGRLLILANFSDYQQFVTAHRLHELGFEGLLADRLTGQAVESWHGLDLQPYASVWLV
jgi:hypothetical protein